MKMNVNFYWNQYSWQSLEQGILDINSSEVPYVNSDSRTFLCSHEVDMPDIETPNREFVAKAMVKALNEQKKELLAETHQKVARIDDKIQQLQALECFGE